MDRISTCCGAKVEILTMPQRDEHDDANKCLCLECGSECDTINKEDEDVS